ncbi:flagellar motor protein MotB [Marmoricola sp. RAF53]|uniref:flagellar motor protein MotB n=1 Tax=Marmoricola sp. RAF53 TaxID=3233059 RepID=UPI003F987470
MPRRKRHEQHEEHENHERWLVTYADMVTLLMVLFIVMFAMSQVDQKKYDALRDGLAAGFGQSPSIKSGNASILEQTGTTAVQSIVPSTVDVVGKSMETPATSKAIAEHEQAKASVQRADAVAEVRRLDDLIRRLYAALRKHHLEDDVQTTIDERGLVVSLVSRHVVFEPNLASLTTRGALIVDTLAPVLRDIPDPLQIDGHTNQVKVKPKYYPSDWDLSSARAVTVLRRLNEQDAVPARRLTASAFGHTKPLIDPAKPGSQRVNKRVDIVILSSLPDETRALINDVIRERRAEGGLS